MSWIERCRRAGRPFGRGLPSIRWVRENHAPRASPLVEIALTRSGAIPEDLIVRTYAASRFEPIALVLNGITARSVNAVLDPVVPTMPLDIPGVLYVDIKSNGRVWEMLRAARLVFASTPALRDDGNCQRCQQEPKFAQANPPFLIPAEIKPRQRGGVRRSCPKSIPVQTPPASTYR